MRISLANDNRSFSWEVRKAAVISSQIPHRLPRVTDKTTATAPNDRLIIRIAMIGAAAFLIATGFRIFPSTAVSAIGVVASLTSYIAGFSLAAAALVTNISLRKATWIVGLAFLWSTVAIVAYEILFEIPTYGTDVMAFTHAGGETLLSGSNPYSVSIEDVRPILNKVGYEDWLSTPTLDGSPLPGITYYPGGHVLFFTAFLGLGLNDLRWVTLLFEVATLTFIWLMVSQVTRLFLPMILLVEPYLTTVFTGGGNSDWLWVAPLAASALMLHQNKPEWAGLWLGIACAIKQHPWIAVPFVAIYVYKVHADTRGIRGLRLFSIMLGLGFILPNLPFILWNTNDWFKGVMGPALLNLVPAGQGVSLLAGQGWMEYSRTGFLMLLALVGSVAIAGYFAFFPRLKDLLWILPPFVMFFSYRSLHSYFIYWIPIVILWLDLVTVQPMDKAKFLSEP